MSNDKTRQTMAEKEREMALISHDRMDGRITFANEIAVSTSMVAIKSLLLINGGAAVAMLGFVSSLAGSEKKAIMIGEAVQPIILFALGVAMAGISSIFAYAVAYIHTVHDSSFLKVWKHPYLIDGKNTNKLSCIGTAVHVLAFIAAIVSMVLFVTGVIAVGDAIANFDNAGITSKELP